MPSSTPNTRRLSSSESGGTAVLPMTSTPSSFPLRPGLLVIGRQRPGFDPDWGKLVEAGAIASLGTIGFGPIATARAVDAASLPAALFQLRTAGVTALFVGQPTMGDGRLVPDLARLWPEPVVLWATPERPGADRVTACALVGQHLFASVLRQLRHPFELVYGAPNDPIVAAALLAAARLVHTVGVLRHTRVGLVGSHAPGFSNLHVDPARLTAAPGPQLVPLGLHEFIDLTRAINPAEVAAETEKIRALQLPGADGIGPAELALDAGYSLALEKLAATHRLHALAFRCWPELPEVLGQWPYLALARLTSDHRALALEGDADGALCALLATELGCGPAFLTDWLAHDEHRVTLWHPGMAPFQLCPPTGAPGGPRLSLHFNNRKPLCVDAELRADLDVTLFRLWSCDGRYHLTAAEGVTERPAPPLAGNSVRVHFADRSVSRWFDELCHAGVPHHFSLVAGRHAETFRRLARLTGLSFFTACTTT